MMAEFTSWDSFMEFAEAITRRARYVRDNETDGFLETVRRTAERRLEVLPPDTSLWRAQLGNDREPFYSDGSLAGDVPCPFGADRMKPQRERATEGRANPKGIPCLYLATCPETAIGETRPWIGSWVSVGLFNTCRELKLVNCITGHKIIDLLEHACSRDLSAEEREKAVWICIDDAFAHPVTPNDNVADYAPTQIIAELFKAYKYDGIAYRSSANETGHNIALFDLDAADMVECQLSWIKGIRVESVPAKDLVRKR